MVVCMGGVKTTPRAACDNLLLSSPPLDKGSEDSGNEIERGIDRVSFIRRVFRDELTTVRVNGILELLWFSPIGLKVRLVPILEAEVKTICASEFTGKRKGDFGKTRLTDRHLPIAPSLFSCFWVPSTLPKRRHQQGNEPRSCGFVWYPRLCLYASWSKNCRKKMKQKKKRVIVWMDTPRYGETLCDT